MPYDPTKTRDSFSALMRIELAATEEDVVAVVKAIREDAIFEDAQAVGTFNEVLGKGSFSITLGANSHVLFNGSSENAQRVVNISKVLAGIMKTHVATDGSSIEHRWGWAGLNADAQGFCRGLLGCRIAGGVSAGARELIDRAKVIIFEELMPELNLPSVSNSGRTPEWVPSEGSVSVITE